MLEHLQLSLRPTLFTLGVVPDNIIQAHGSFATQRCIECKRPYVDEKMQQCISRSVVPRCDHEDCHGLVKPDIVFFGEALPPDFHKQLMLPRYVSVVYNACREYAHDFACSSDKSFSPASIPIRWSRWKSHADMLRIIYSESDLCIIMGTSLTVQPFASLPQLCCAGTPRLLINRERVGGLGTRPDDVVILEDCDSGIRRLAAALGWIDELERAWTRTQGIQVVANKANPQTDPDDLEQRIDRLAEEIDDSLKLSRDHRKYLQTLTGSVSDQDHR